MLSEDGLERPDALPHKVIGPLHRIPLYAVADRGLKRLHALPL